MNTQVVKVGICGLGTVGGGTFNVLQRNAAEVAARAGAPVQVVHIGARRDNPACDLSGTQVSRDIFAVVDDPDVQILVELIGGTTVAKDRVATAIRNYSAYTRGHYGQEHTKARYDLLWLADCLHTFDRVGKALAGGSQRALSAACEELLSMYDTYLKDGSGYDSRDTFRRLSDRVPLAGVTDAIRAIAMKTAADGEVRAPVLAARA